MEYFFDNLKNSFDFTLRSKLKFSRKNYSIKVDWKNFLRDIYYFNIFKKCFTIQNKKISILDIGSKNWEYIGGEYYFFKTFSDDFILNGIELDAYRLNSNFYTRFEIAKSYIKDMSEAKYIPEDFLKHNKKYNYIISILPFITKYPLVRWGLPLKYFKPLEMLNHAYNLLEDNGELVIINQGEDEYEIQKELNEKLNLNVKYYGEIEDRFNLFKNKRYCSKIIKNTKF